MVTPQDLTNPAARMAVPVRLRPEAHAKPWGRAMPGPWGLRLEADHPGTTIGEIHHQGLAGAESELLVKTLFTAERLSIQVHPDAPTARALGLRRGKDEAWVVLAAEPGATIGLGLSHPSTSEALRTAALDGSIVDLLEWHPCAAGDVFFVPAGSIHAIGGGITLFEVQQNCDVTWRLFDYGRGRPLHLDAGLAVAHPGPWAQAAPRAVGAADRLVDAAAFVLDRVRGPGQVTPPADGPVWVAVVAGSGTIGGLALAPGEVWLATAPAQVAGDVELVLAAAGQPAVIWQEQ